MTFFEQKEKAKKDGMEVSGKTTKADIEAFYAAKEATIDVEEVIEAEVAKEVVKEVIKEVIVEVPAKCNHNYEFKTMQAVRGPKPLDTEGNPRFNRDGGELKGRLSYKFKYECSHCGDVVLRDK